MNTDIYPPSPNHEAFRSALRTTIQAFASSGVKYFQLIGDWSDWREFTDWTIYPSLWRDASWEATRQSWVTQFNPHQDRHDLIPSFVVADTVRSQNMDYVRPYDYTDLPYADTNDDGIPDVVVTRWPLADSVAVVALAFKMQSYNDWPVYPGHSPRLLLTVNDLSAAVSTTADSIVTDVAGEAFVMRVNALTDFQTFRSRVTSAWNSNLPEMVVSVATWSDEWDPCSVFRNFPEAAMSAVTPPVIAGSCSANRWADPHARGADRFERILTAVNRGAVAWIGPSSSSWAEGNGPAVRYTVQEIFEDTNRPLAESWLVGMQRVFSQYRNQPDIIKTTRTYAFMGDPLTKLRHYPIPTDITEQGQAPSLRVGLVQNAPNPFNPVTRIAFTTTRKGLVVLKVYDIQGRCVRTLIEASLPAGHHDVTWKGDDEHGNRVGSGIYLYRLVAEGSTLTRKLALVK